MYQNTAASRFAHNLLLQVLLCQVADVRVLRKIALLSKWHQKLSYEFIWRSVTWSNFLRVLPEASIRGAVHTTNPNHMRRMNASLALRSATLPVLRALPLVQARKLEPYEWDRVQEVARNVRFLQVHLHDCRGRSCAINFYKPFITSFPSHSLFSRLKNLTLNIDCCFASCEPFLLHVVSRSPLSELRIIIHTPRLYWAPELISLVYSILDVLPCLNLKVLGILYKSRDNVIKSRITESVLNAIVYMPRLETLILPNICSAMAPSPNTPLYLEGLRELYTAGGCLSNLEQALRRSSTSSLETLWIVDIPVTTTAKDLEEFFVGLASVAPRLEHLQLELELVWRLNRVNQTPSSSVSVSNFLPLSRCPRLRRVSFRDNTFGLSPTFLDHLSQSLPGIDIDIEEQQDEYFDKWFDLA